MHLKPPSSPLPPGLDMMRPTCRGGTSGSSGARGRTAAISSGTGNEALDSRGCRVRVPAAGWRWWEIEEGGRIPQPIVEAGRSAPSENIVWKSGRLWMNDSALLSRGHKDHSTECHGMAEGVWFMEASRTNREVHHRVVKIGPCKEWHALISGSFGFWLKKNRFGRFALLPLFNLSIKAWQNVTTCIKIYRHVTNVYQNVTNASKCKTPSWVPQQDSQLSHCAKNDLSIFIAPTGLTLDLQHGKKSDDVTKFLHKAPITKRFPIPFAEGQMRAVLKKPHLFTIRLEYTTKIWSKIQTPILVRTTRGFRLPQVCFGFFTCELMCVVASEALETSNWMPSDVQSEKNFSQRPAFQEWPMKRSTWSVSVLFAKNVFLPHLETSAGCFGLAAQTKICWSWQSQG